MKIVSLVGGAKTTRDLYKDYPADEIWTLAYLYKLGMPADLIFEMHLENDIPTARIDYDRLGVPYLDLYSYPLDDIKKDLFTNLPVDELFTSSFDYMLAGAIHSGVYSRIQIFGFEMEMTTEWFYQRPGAYLMMGIAAGRGIEIFLPPESKLMRPQLYGYEGIPKISPQVVERLDWLKNSYERAENQSG